MLPNCLSQGCFHDLWTLDPSHSSSQVTCPVHFSCMKSIEHSLPVTCLWLSIWDTVVKPAVSPSLQRARISETALRIPLFAPPPCCGGFGWKHPFHLQGFTHISTCIQEAVTVSQTSSLLQQSHEALIMEAGVPIELGDSAFDRHLTCLSPSWLPSTW